MGPNLLDQSPLWDFVNGFTNADVNHIYHTALINTLVISSKNSIKLVRQDMAFTKLYWWSPVSHCISKWSLFISLTIFYLVSFLQLVLGSPVCSYQAFPCCAAWKRLLYSGSSDTLLVSSENVKNSAIRIYSISKSNDHLSWIWITIKCIVAGLWVGWEMMYAISGRFAKNYLQNRKAGQWNVFIIHCFNWFHLHN